MSIYGDFQKFAQDLRIELFVLDTGSYGAGVFRFHAGTNEFNGDIIWQGQTYTSIPLEATGFEFDGTRFPRPKLSVANANGVLSALVRQYDDLVGSKVTRKRTTARYLDAANFISGNPTANPAEHLPDEIYYIVQKTGENRVQIDFELGSALDLSGVMLPKRQVLANICPFKYRSQECSYAGGAVAKADDSPTTVLAEDACSKTINGCKLRFGSNGELPFGGFPGSALVDFR